MTAAPRVGRADRRRLGMLFLAYFALAGLIAPFLPLYLEARGLGAAQIGVAMALAQGLRVVGPNLWGWLADRSARRTTILRATAAGIALSFAGLFVAGGFGWILLVIGVLNVFMTAQMPLGEAIAAAQLRDRADAARGYGRLRVWGSIGFIVVVLACGALFDRIGVGFTPHAGTLLALLLVVAAWRVRDAPHALAGATVSVRRRLAEPAVRWFFGSAALMVFAHSAYYTYFSLFLAQLGYSTAAIGVFWVIGVLVEIGVFYAQGRIFGRWPVLAVLGATCAAAALRFVLIAEFASVWGLLVLAQALHALTFAVHHSAAVLTIQRWFPGAAAARGQALYISFAYGVGGTSGSLVAAAMWSRVDPSAVFLTSSVAALAAWWAVRRVQDAGADARAGTPMNLSSDRRVEP